MNRFSVVHVSAWLPLVLPLAFGVSCERAAESHPEPDGEAVEVPESNPRLPGFASVDEALQTRLGRALASKGPAYVPRTRHLDESGAPKYTNRLIEQGSPYLLQHAHNPVSWYAWSDEAFERAKRENKPIFLSVGYSTCHWCHVMERESFEDEQIAEFLNRHFIAIKVDREERPDIDSVYMSAVNILTGRGGWPMTIVMTPDKEPFFAGTYFPPHEGVRGSGAGLSDILAEMLRVYTNQPQQVVARAQELSQRIEQVASIRAGPGVPSDKTIAIAAQQYATMFDRVDGGFTGAPKFPQPSRLLLLLRYARRTGDDGATAMVATTLDRMAAGGIYDQIGGGFHRYSTDAEWLVPHFEKMLYDNAQLALVYIETWQVTSDSDYSRVAREILDYVAREMISPDGGFYSATDADSPTPEGHEEEGWFYTWTPAELESFLGADDVRIVSAAYGVTEGGNFEGRNILHRVLSDRELASGLRVPRRRVSEVLNSARKILYAARTLRPAPLRDEKIIAAWNGMMISAFAKVGWALGEHSYTQIAERAAKFVLERMRARDGSLVRTHSGGGTGGTSFLDDYAFMIAASLDLYETTGDQAWLERAIGLQTEQDLRYGDSEGGGYYLTPRGGETLLVREKPTYDGAVPSGNSVAASNLLRLHDLTGAESWRQKAERLFAMLGFRVTRSPTEYPLLLTALDHYYDKPLEVAVIAATNREDAAPLSRPLRETFVPNKAFVVLASDDAVEQTTKVPWLEGKVAIAGKSTAYVCERGSCALPTSDASVLQRQLGRSVPYPSFAKEPPPRLPFKRSN